MDKPIFEKRLVLADEFYHRTFENKCGKCPGIAPGLGSISAFLSCSVFPPREELIPRTAAGNQASLQSMSRLYRRFSRIFWGGAHASSLFSLFIILPPLPTLSHRLWTCRNAHSNDSSPLDVPISKWLSFTNTIQLYQLYYCFNVTE